MDNWANPDARYLGLTGIVVENDHYRDSTHPEFEALKQEFFPHSPDDPVILVRNQIVRQVGPFWRFQDPEFCKEWEDRIINFFQAHIRRIFTVVIDKQSHHDRYGLAARHPYHYCATVLTERFRGRLNATGLKGDVLAESRSGTADRELEKVFRDFMESGSDFLSPQELQECITSKEIKLKPKQSNITGLQLADSVAYPAKIDVLQANGRQPTTTPSLATRRINEAISKKYNQFGKIFLS
jgi:hypothetical protein